VSVITFVLSFASGRLDCGELPALIKRMPRLLCYGFITSSAN